MQVDQMAGMTPEGFLVVVVEIICSTILLHMG